MPIMQEMSFLGSNFRGGHTPGLPRELVPLALESLGREPIHLNALPPPCKGL